MKTAIEPDAAAILTSLALKPQTSGELANGLAVEGDVVRRMLRKLDRNEQITKNGRTDRWGRAEHLYSVNRLATVLPPEDLAGLPKRVLEEADSFLLRAMSQEAAEAIDAGTFESRADRCLVRFPISLDERGFRRALDLHRMLLLDVIAEVEAAEARLATGREAPIEASAHVLLCEYPRGRQLGSPAEVESGRRGASRDRLEKVFGVITDPLCNRVLNALTLAPASVKELAARLQLPASKIRYELDRLLDDEMVRVIRRKRRRGTVERVFVCEVRGHTLGTEDLERHTGQKAKAMDKWVVRTVFSEALETIREEAPRAVGDVVIARLVMAIDAEGFAAISARIEAVLSELFVLRDGCVDALGEDEAPARFALSGFFLFERAVVQRQKR